MQAALLGIMMMVHLCGVYQYAWQVPCSISSQCPRGLHVQLKGKLACIEISSRDCALFHPLFMPAAGIPVCNKTPWQPYMVMSCVPLRTPCTGTIRQYRCLPAGLFEYIQHASGNLHLHRTTEQPFGFFLRRFLNSFLLSECCALIIHELTWFRASAYAYHGWSSIQAQAKTKSEEESAAKDQRKPRR